ncbi:hypothetical protein ACIQWA_34925 [Kitasatospora sp. NPDC098652]|uniref:hypothetical protein n=1 Tax=Kitasatospora sp. NPDC098652 TaxID=3364095 RepID=UPI00380A517C
MTDPLPPDGLVLGTDEPADRWADAWRSEQAAPSPGGGLGRVTGPGTGLDKPDELDERENGRTWN